MPHVEQHQDVPADARRIIDTAVEQDGTYLIFASEWGDAEPIVKLGLGTLSKIYTPATGQPYRVLELTDEAVDMSETRAIELRDKIARRKGKPLRQPPPSKDPKRQERKRQGDIYQAQKLAERKTARASARARAVAKRIKRRSP